MRSSFLLVPFLAFSAAAQEPQLLVLEGDPVAGAGLVTSIANLAVDDSGNWYVEVDTDLANTDADGAVVGASGTLWLEGAPLAEPSGANLDTFDSLVVDGTGRLAQNFILSGAVTTADNAGVYVDDSLVVRKGDTSTAPGYSGVFGSFSDVKIEGGGRLLLRGFGDDPAVAGTSDWFAIVATVNAAGDLVSESVIAKEGDVPPGQTLAINTIRSGSHAGAINAAGDVLWCADLDASSVPSDAVCYLNGTLIAQEGMPSPVAGRNWGDLLSPEVDLNSAGDWTFKDRLDSTDFSSDEIILKNGAVFRREGDSIPAIAPFAFERFGNGPVDLSEAGDVLWFGDWDTVVTADEGLFLNETLLVQEGVTTVGGQTIVGIGDQSDNYFISDNGRYVIFEAVLPGGLEGAFLLSLGLGDRFCVGAPNSTGVGATIAASGSDVVLDQDLTLTAVGLPAGVPGLFFFGPNQVQVAFGDGFRCVGGATRRIQPVAFASGAGAAQRALDFGLPYGTSIQAGTNLSFQFWYRDGMAGMSGFNLSDGIGILWQ